jgi:putative phosphoesterase
MKIAVLSDIHDNVWNLQAALPRLQDADALIFCGDLCSPFTANLLAKGFRDRPIHIVFGNNDGDLFRISRVAGKHAHVSLHGELFQAELDGKSFAAVHFDNIAVDIVHSGRYDVVCYGHNHHYQVEQVGRTLAINPGTLMGFDPYSLSDIAATFVIYDTQSGETQRMELSEGNKKT